MPKVSSGSLRLSGNAFQTDGLLNVRFYTYSVGPSWSIQFEI